METRVKFGSHVLFLVIQFSATNACGVEKMSFGRCRMVQLVGRPPPPLPTNSPYFNNQTKCDLQVSTLLIYI